MSEAPAARALVLGLGPGQGDPWWWEQLAGNPLRDCILAERVTIKGKTQRQLGLADLPAVIAALARVLRRARRDRIGYVITFESDLSCYLIGLLQWLPWYRGPKHAIVQFISRERRPGIVDALKDFAARCALATVFRVVCSSRAEARYYRERFHWSESKAVFVPFHTNRRFLERAQVPARDAIVAAGRSYRDYATLIAAVAGTGIRTVIVCGKGGPGVEPLPAEVEVVTEIPLEQLIDLMASARAHVLPLEAKKISTGQTVLLQAMALGKPVIATRTAGTEDYIEHGVTGLLVPPADPLALRGALLGLWADPERLRTLGTAARAAVANSYLPAHYAAGVARALGCRVSLQ